MSNTQKSAEPAPVIEDCGLGYCVPCLNRYITGELREHPPHALALIPVPGVPFPLAGCYHCIKGLLTMSPNGRRSLWTGP